VEPPESDQARQQRHRATGQLFSQVPALAQAWAQGYRALRFDHVPFTPLRTPLPACRVALVTTGGIHRHDQPPFTMADSRGDASYRHIPADTPDAALTVTHDYYNHEDVRRDFNIIFPRTRHRRRQRAARPRAGSTELQPDSGRAPDGP
jgi:D-proline reductase (dithiol) PrdB